MSNEFPRRDDPVVVFIDTHWRPQPGYPDKILDGVRRMRRRSRLEDAVAVATLAAAALLFVWRSRGAVVQNVDSVWLEGTSISSAASPYDGEFMGLQRIFLEGEPR